MAASEIVSRLMDIAKKSHDSEQAKVQFDLDPFLKEHSSFSDIVSPAYWQIMIKAGVSAREVCKELSLKRCYLISGDVHQKMFSIQVWIADIPGQRISVQSPKIGKWTLNARGDRPVGEVPKVSNGASPAYDLEKYDTMITRFFFSLNN